MHMSTSRQDQVTRLPSTLAREVEVNSSLALLRVMKRSNVPVPFLYIGK